MNAYVEMLCGNADVIYPEADHDATYFEYRLR